MALPVSNLRTIWHDSGLQIAQGNVSTHSFVHKFGYAPDFDQADGEVTVWDGAEDGTAWELMNYNYSTTADIDSISSSDNSDTMDITVVGLDTNYAEVTQTVTLTGQTRAALSTSLIRVYRAYNGNATAHAGHIFVYKNGATTGGVPDTNADIRAIIDPNAQQTLMALYTVPADKTAYMTGFYVSTAGGNKSSNYIFRIKSREQGKVFRLKHLNAISDNGTSAHRHDYQVPEIFTEKSDIELSVEMIVAGGTTASISGGFDIVLVDN